jgi:hypothetical protein
MMDAICSSESSFSFFTRATQCHILEDDTIHSHRRENLKSYIKLHIDALNNWLQISLLTHHKL